MTPHAEDCPFCGEVPTVLTDSDIPGLSQPYAECDTEDCLLYGPRYRLAEWNKRPGVAK